MFQLYSKRSVWMTHDPITGGIKQVEKNYTGGSFLVWTGELIQRSDQMKLTFHPRRSLLLSPDLSVWKKKKKKKRKIKAHLLQHLSNSQTEQNINKKKQIRKLGEVGKLF